MRKTSSTARILRAAAELFAEYGYHGTGMAQLEESVSIKRGALYHHIGSKEALLYEISSSQLRVMVETAERLEQEINDPEERFRQIAGALLDNVASHPVEWRVHYRDFNCLTGERMQSVLDLRRRYEDVWQRTLRLGIEDGHFRGMSSDVALKGIMGMFNYSYVWIASTGPEAPTKIASLFCDIFLDGIRAVPGDVA